MPHRAMRPQTRKDCESENLVVCGMRRRVGWSAWVGGRWAAGARSVVQTCAVLPHEIWITRCGDGSRAMPCVMLSCVRHLT